VLASRTALNAGGETLDVAIVDRLADDFLSAHAIDLRQDPLALSRLLDAAERARHELSAAPSTQVNLPFITADHTGPKHLQRDFGRAELDALSDAGPLGAAVVALCEGALEDAGVAKEDVAALVLTGGAMRAPHLRARVEEAVGLRAVEVALSPEDLGVSGAALQDLAAAALSRTSAGSEGAAQADTAS